MIKVDLNPSASHVEMNCRMEKTVVNFNMKVKQKNMVAAFNNFLCQKFIRGQKKTAGSLIHESPPQAELLTGSHVNRWQRRSAVCCHTVA